MRIAQAGFNLLVVNPFAWSANWAWALPLIVLTVVIHVLGLAFVSQRVIRISNRMIGRRSLMMVFAVIMGVTTLLATCLHAMEVGIWALTYVKIGAFPDFGSSMLYSLNAITSYGHTDLSLANHWQLMGALESLNGWLLFGLTTAFMFAVVQRVWSSGLSQSRSATSASADD